MLNPEEEGWERADLEHREYERTQELFIVNEQIKRELARQREIESDLRKSRDNLKALYEASRMREHMYHACLAASPDAIVMYDEHGNTRYVSPSFTRLFGWTAEEIKGLRIPYVPDSEVDHTLRLIDRVWREGFILSAIEAKRYTKDGHLLTVSMSASRYYDEAGQPIGIMVILRDITERKRMEKALAQSEERFRTLAHVSPFGLAVIAADETTEYINPKFTEIFGFTIKDVPDLESWFQKAYPNGDHWKEVKKLWKRETEDIEVVTASGAETCPRTLILCCKNGEQRTVAFRAVVLADGRIIATFLDITPEVRAQAELLRANNEWERTFHAVSDLIFILDDKRRIVRINRALAERLGVTVEALEGMSWDTTLTSDKTLASLCPTAPTGADIQEHRTEIVDEKLGGVFDLRISPLRDSEGYVSGSVHVARDLTAFKSLERARRLAVHHLAHELTTPVAVIQASLKKLADADVPVRQQEERITRITRNLRRLKEIQRVVADMVAPPRYRPRRFSVETSLRDIILDIRTRSTHRSTVLDAWANCDQCDAVDPEIFTEAANTLLKNAIENTPDEGEVKLSVTQGSCGLLLEVKDTGVGIAPRDEAFIFDAFHHTQATSNYATRQPFDFNAGGKGLELTRLRMLADSCFFSVSFRTRRCCHLSTNGTDCPGSVSACAYVSSLEDCRASGGTTFSVLFHSPTRCNEAP